MGSLPDKEVLEIKYKLTVLSILKSITIETCKSDPRIAIKINNLDYLAEIYLSQLDRSPSGEPIAEEGRSL